MQEERAEGGCAVCRVKDSILPTAQLKTRVFLQEKRKPSRISNRYPEFFPTNMNREASTSMLIRDQGKEVGRQGEEMGEIGGKYETARKVGTGKVKITVLAPQSLLGTTYH